MTPRSMSDEFPAARRVATNGIELAVYEAGPPNGPAVVFCHGFPELAFAWRFQLPAVAAAGYRAIAPDQRGYGASDRPAAVEAYDIHQLTGDLAGLLDALEVERAVFCGHDWGTTVAWSMARLYPDRVAGVIAMSTPYWPRGPIDPIDHLRAEEGESHYVVEFQQLGVADELFAQNVEAVFRVVFGKSISADEFAALPEQPKGWSFIEAVEAFDPTRMPQLVVEPDALDHFVAVYGETGFSGGINWYRNLSRNWETTADVPDHVGAPALMISGADDLSLPPAMTEGMEQWVPDLEKHFIADCGHWTQQEKPEETNALIVDWLQRRFPT